MNETRNGPMTVGELARRAGLSVQTIDSYVKKGELEFVTASNGVRLYSEDQVERVHAVHQQNIARRRIGRPRKKL